MYTLPKKIIVFSIILMVIGLIGMVVGIVNAPNSKDDVKEMLLKEQAHLEHEATIDDDHVYHVYHQLSNRPWSAIYVSALFFFFIAVGVLAFYAIQQVSQAGWSPVLYRVMEGITGYLLPGSIVMFLLLAFSVFGINHIFHWMDPELFDPESEKYDYLVAGKAAWLNTPGFLIRAAFYLIGWNLYRYFSRKYSKLQDEEGGTYWFKKNFRISAGFLAFFFLTEMMMSWDWIMTFDPHWFSTLFGWYVLSGMLACAVTVVAMVTIYLKSQGYLEYVNNSHIHDLAKFMFGFSIFWTYLWFSQFLLIWYANIPEEVTYFVSRINDYNFLFFGMVVLNFVLPLLLLINSDFKRVNSIVIGTGIIILIGQFINVYVMVMPGTVGASWYIGIPEIGALLFFLGLFILTVFKSITKAPLLVKGNPFIEESKHFHY